MDGKSIAGPPLSAASFLFDDRPSSRSLLGGTLRKTSPSFRKVQKEVREGFFNSHSEMALNAPTEERFFCSKEQSSPTENFFSKCIITASDYSIRTDSQSGRLNLQFTIFDLHCSDCRCSATICTNNIVLVLVVKSFSLRSRKCSKLELPTLKCHNSNFIFESLPKSK